MIFLVKGATYHIYQIWYVAPLTPYFLLPMYGIFSTYQQPARVGYKVDEHILDLTVAASLGIFADLLPQTVDSVFNRPVLNDFMALGTDTCRAITQRIRDYLPTAEAQTSPLTELLFVSLADATLHLPVRIGDYTDFYAGIHHAENAGRMFRPNADPLLPNYRQMPVAYHGRASSIVVSGTPIKRPAGQYLRGSDVVFGPTQALDFELELGLIIGRPSSLGKPIPIDEAEAYIFGVVLFNDWSARDIQRWEYQPLGPFLGKSFGSSMSAWVLPFHDLEPFRVAGPEQEPTPLPYLQSVKPGHFDLPLEVRLNDSVISRSNARYLYWSFAQMIAHHTSNGCNLNIGDILATGTISGPTPGSYGSLLELTWNGTRPLSHPDGIPTTFLANGDTITMYSRAETNGLLIELGEVTGTITA